MTIIDDTYVKFCTERFLLPAKSQVEELEQRIGVTFPEDYRRFILEYNGGYFGEPEITPVVEGCPEDVLLGLHGIAASHWESELAETWRLTLFDDNDPPKIVPIGHTYTGGLIVLVTEPEGRGEIYLKEAYGDFYFLADGIEAFFELLEEAPLEEAPPEQID